MHLYKQVLKHADAEGQVLNYEPRAFQHNVPGQAVSFLKSVDQNGENREFEIAALVAQRTGLTELEKKNYQAKIESDVLVKLKEVEEKAYKEAYDLGLQEGREKALQETKASVDESVLNITKIISELTNLKTTLTVANEKSLIETVLHLAKALAFKEIKSDTSMIAGVLAKALENAQNEEEIVIRVSVRDAKFLEGIKSQPGNPFEKLNRYRLEGSERITDGGCLVETNYGVIDATVEQRVSKLWQALEEKIPVNTEVK